MTPPLPVSLGIAISDFGPSLIRDGANPVLEEDTLAADGKEALV